MRVASLRDCDCELKVLWNGIGRAVSIWPGPARRTSGPARGPTGPGSPLAARPVQRSTPDCRRRCSIAVSASWSYEGELCRAENSHHSIREGVFRRCSTSVESSSNWPQNVAFYSCIQALFENMFRTAYNVWFLGLYLPLLLWNCSGFIVF